MSISQPANRNGDNYAEAITRKIVSVFVLAMNEKVDLVVWGGDFSHRPQLPPRVLVPIVAAMVDYVSMGGKVAFAVGNHDIEGHDPSTYYRGPLGLFHVIGRAMDSSIVVGYDPEKPFGIYMAKDIVPGVNMAMVPEVHDDPNTYRELLAYIEDVVNWVHVIVLHAPVTTDPDYAGFYIHPDDLPLLAGQICLCGHIHNNIGVVPTASGATVIIPGALARRSIDERDRTPCVFIIHTGPRPTAAQIEVPHTPGREIFKDPLEANVASVVAERIASVRDSYESLGTSGESTGVRVSPRSRLEKYLEPEEPRVRSVTLRSYDEAIGGQ